MKWDRLLQWMTHIGSGPWDAFRQGVDELDESSSADRHQLYRDLRIALSDLGHADFFVGGSRRWRIRRPALVGISQRDHKHLFTGGRSVGLASELDAAARNAEAVVTVGQDYVGPLQIHVEGDPARLERIAQDLGIDYLRNGATTLATRLPSLRSTLDISSEVDEPIGWDVRSWSFEEACWVEKRLYRTLREYKNRHGVRQYLVDTGPRHLLRAVEKSAGMYCAALARKARLMHYSEDNQTLRVPWWAPLPTEHARVACLSGGRLASLKNGQIVFSGVDGRTASILLASLGQGALMPRISK